MAQTDDRSASAMPKALVICAIALFVLRVGACAFEFATPKSSSGGKTIHWIQASDITTFPPPSDKKLVLYEFCADWSDPSTRMDTTALSNGQIGDLVKANFCPVRVADRQKEKGKNPQFITDLQKRYRIFAFPTLVAVGPDGETAGQLVGCCSSLTTYRFLSRALHNRTAK